MQNYLINIFYFLTLCFLFVFISFVSLRWTDGENAINASVISLDLIRVILVCLHVLLSFYNVEPKKRYLPMIFTVLATLFTSATAPQDETGTYLGLFHSLNFSYLFLEVSLSFLANHLSKEKDEISQKEKEIEQLKNTIENRDVLLNVKENLFKEVCSELNQANEILNNFKHIEEEIQDRNIIINTFVSHIRQISGTLITDSHKQGILMYDNKKGFYVQEISKKQENKPNHIFNILQP